MSAHPLLINMRAVGQIAASRSPSTSVPACLSRRSDRRDLHAAARPRSLRSWSVDVRVQLDRDRGTSPTRRRSTDRSARRRRAPRRAPRSPWQVGLEVRRRNGQPQVGRGREAERGARQIDVEVERRPLLEQRAQPAGDAALGRARGAGELAEPAPVRRARARRASRSRTRSSAVRSPAGCAARRRRRPALLGRGQHVPHADPVRGAAAGEPAQDDGRRDVQHGRRARQAVEQQPFAGLAGVVRAHRADQLRAARADAHPRHVVGRWLSARPRSSVASGRVRMRSIQSLCAEGARVDGRDHPQHPARCSRRYRRATVCSDTPSTAAIRLNAARGRSCRQRTICRPARPG